ncbi:MAG: hypothetical protein MK160_00660 [Rhodobacteraceae bacterium]|nr:hypothetical protein [Paracoccaceae bacterium]
MKKLSLFAVAATLAVSTAAPLAAENAEVNDPFLLTQGMETMPLLIIGGTAATIVIVGTSSGSGSGT